MMSCGCCQFAALIDAAKQSRKVSLFVTGIKLFFVFIELYEINFDNRPKRNPNLGKSLNLLVGGDGLEPTALSV